MDAAVLELQKLVTAQNPEKADAIVWLQGDRYDRGEKVFELWKKGFAPVIFLTGNNTLIGAQTRPGENNCSVDEMRQWLLDKDVPDSVILLDCKALNTRGQAVNTFALAEQNKWRKILLVGSTHHQLRAFLTFLKRAQEINWQGTIINQPVFTDTDAVPGGRIQTSQEIFEDEIAKVHTYTEHVAAPEEGLEYFNKPQFHFRPATLSDSELLLIWRNDPSAYQNFFNAKPVSMEEHRAWLEKSLSDPNRALIIVENTNNETVGQIRFDIDGEEAEISITLAPDQRGRGYGSVVIASASQYFFKNNPAVKKIIAQIKPENKASAFAFLKAGYTPLIHSFSENHLDFPDTPLSLVYNCVTSM